MFRNILIIVSSNFLLLQGLVNGQSGNCHFDLIPDDATTFEITGLRELSAENTTLWSSPTQFVTAAAVVNSPHTKYISGLRYSSRYEYDATDDFANFILHERSDIVQRDVTYTCANGGTRHITFHFHIDDENNMPPTPDSSSELVYIKSKSEAVGDIEVLGTFTTVDLDFWEVNGNLSVISSRPTVFPVQAALKSGVDHARVGWTWEIQLSIDWTLAVIGEWNFLVIFNDGKWSRSRSVVVDVVG